MEMRQMITKPNSTDRGKRQAKAPQNLNLISVVAQPEPQPSIKAIKRALAERIKDAGRDEIELTAGKPDSVLDGRHMLFKRHEADAAARWAFDENLQNRRNVGVSLSIGVMRPYRKPGAYKRELAQLNCVHVNITLPAEKMTCDQQEAWKNERGEHFTAHLPNDVPDGFEIVDCASGFTLVWPLSSVLRATRDNAAHVKDINKRLSALLGGRNSYPVSVDSRLHLAGTVAWPTPVEIEQGRTAARVVLERPANSVFSLRDFA